MKRLKKTASFDVTTYLEDIMEEVNAGLINVAGDIAAQFASDAGYDLDDDDDDDYVIELQEEFGPDFEKVEQIKVQLKAIMDQMASDMLARSLK